MSKPPILVLSVSLVSGACAMNVTAATWTYMGTSGFTIGPGLPKVARQLMGDGSRVVFSGTVVDSAGNVYVVANNLANAGVAGGVSIFKPQQGGYDRIDVNLTGLSLYGGITKLVLAGDGKVYACQNWREIKYQFPANSPASIPNRILRINLDGTVGVIHEEIPVQCPDNSVWSNPHLNKIGGMAVAGDGNVYWWQAGANKFWQQPTNTMLADCSADVQWRQHVLWRYNVTGGVVEEAPINLMNVDNGNTDPVPPDFSVYNMINMFNLEYIGQDDVGSHWFAVIQNIGAKSWRVDIIGWYAGAGNPNQFRRRSVTHGESTTPDPAGRNFITALVYDPAGKALWAGGVDQDINGKVCIMTRWVNTNAAWTNPGLIHHVDPNPNKPVDEGITAYANWHANGNGDGSKNKGRYWVASLAVSPYDSRAWMSWGGECYGYNSTTGTCDTSATGKTYNPDPSVTYGPLGHVYSMAKTDANGPSADEGRPQSANPDSGKAADDSQVVALTFSRYGDPRNRLRAYALTVDLITGEYNLFWAYAEPQQIVGACCQFKCVCSDNMTQQACTAVNGVWQGQDTTCAQTDCTYQVCNDPFADIDCDGDVDQEDFAAFQRCYTGINGTIPSALLYCQCLDRLTGSPPAPDDHIDQTDLTAFEACASGPGVPADVCCDGGLGCP